MFYKPCNTTTLHSWACKLAARGTRHPRGVEARAGKEEVGRAEEAMRVLYVVGFLGVF